MGWADVPTDDPTTGQAGQGSTWADDPTQPQHTPQQTRERAGRAVFRKQ